MINFLYIIIEPNIFYGHTICIFVGLTFDMFKIIIPQVYLTRNLILFFNDIVLDFSAFCLASQRCTRISRN